MRIAADVVYAIVSQSRERLACLCIVCGEWGFRIVATMSIVGVLRHEHNFASEIVFFVTISCGSSSISGWVCVRTVPPSLFSLPSLGPFGPPLVRGGGSMLGRPSLPRAALRGLAGFWQPRWRRGLVVRSTPRGLGLLCSSLSF